MKTIQKIFDISSIQRITFRQDINGLRALSVLAVVFYHADFETFKGGWLGVDIFFVISGYLISNIIISELNNNSFSFKNFYLKRAKRILPALASTLLITVPLAYLLLTPKAMVEFSRSVVASVFFYANYFFQNLDFYNAEPSKYMPLLHTWSLAIEEQYYLLFPLIAVFLYSYFKKSFSYVIALLLVFSLLLNSTDQSIEKFYQLQFRAWELLLGVIVMVVASNIKLKNIELLGFLFIIFSITYFDDSYVNQLEPKVISLAGVAIIIISNSEQSFLSKILNNKMFEIIGLSSFSIYLLHQPFFAFSRIYFRGRLSSFSTTIKLSLILITLLFGYMSYFFVERRLPRFKYLFPILTIIFLVVLLFAGSSIENKGFNSRFKNNLEKLDSYYSYSEQRATIDINQCNKNPLFKDFEYFCNINFDKRNKNLIIIGDSHMETVAKYILDSVNIEKYNFFFSIYQGCPFVVPVQNNESRANCGNSKKLSELNNILEYDNSYLVFGGRFPWYYNGEAFETNLGTIGDDTSNGEELIIEGLKKNIEFFTKNVNNLFIIYPVPELGYYPLEPYLYGYVDIEDEITYDISYWKEYSKEITSYFDTVNTFNTIKIYPEKYFCDSYFTEVCTSSYNGIFFYYDDDHLTINGAKFIGDKILILLK